VERALLALSLVPEEPVCALGPRRDPRAARGEVRLRVRHVQHERAERAEREGDRVRETHRGGRQRACRRGYLWGWLPQVIRRNASWSAREAAIGNAGGLISKNREQCMICSQMSKAKTQYSVTSTSSSGEMTRPAKRSGAGVASETRDGAEHLMCWPRLLLPHHFAAASTSELRAVVRALNLVVSY
jgi:hypothetical protein